MGSQTPIPPKQTDHDSWSSAIQALHAPLPVPVGTNLILRVIDMDGEHVEVEAGIAFEVGDQPQVLKYRGVANLDPGDVFDAQIGFRLAAGRALSGLGARLERQANGRIREAENVAEAREVAKAEQAIRTERGILRKKSKNVVHEIIELGATQERSRRRFGRRRRAATA